MRWDVRGVWAADASDGHIVVDALSQPAAEALAVGRGLLVESCTAVVVAVAVVQPPPLRFMYPPVMPVVLPAPVSGRGHFLRWLGFWLVCSGICIAAVGIPLMVLIVGFALVFVGGWMFFFGIIFLVVGLCRW